MGGRICTVGIHYLLAEKGLVINLIMVQVLYLTCSSQFSSKQICVKSDFVVFQKCFRFYKAVVFIVEIINIKSKMTYGLDLTICFLYCSELLHKITVLGCLIHLKTLSLPSPGSVTSNSTCSVIQIGVSLSDTIIRGVEMTKL